VIIANNRNRNRLERLLLFNNCNCNCLGDLRLFYNWRLTVIQSNNRRFYNRFFFYGLLKFFFKCFGLLMAFFVLILWDWPICFAYFKGLMPKYFKKDRKKNML
jgi:hypothetical protein